MMLLAVPYHLDDHLPDLDLPLDVDRTMTAPLPPGAPWQRMAALYDAVAREVAEIAGRSESVAVLSGDCTTSLAVVAGLQRSGRAPGVVWFDAHGDLHTPESTTSGYLGGMPLRMLIGEGDPTVPVRLGLRPVPEQQVVLVDGRDLDPAEQAYLAGSSVRHMSVGDLRADLLPDGPLYLHIDVDTLDPSEVPGLLFPAPAGPRLADVTDAALGVLETGRVAALGLACTYRPGSGGADAARRLADDLVAAL